MMIRLLLIMLWQETQPPPSSPPIGRVTADVGTGRSMIE